MKFAIVLLAVLSVVVAKQTYDKAKWKKLDVAAITKNPPLMKSYLLCLKDASVCDEFFGGYRDDFVDILDHACAKCSSSMKSQVFQLFTSSTLRFPAEVAAVTRKLDPKGTKMPALLLAIAF